ncbi:hypothetical protein ILUMI_23392 [Ignelater luminosus]|uniref:Transposase n=1 Tax=Ignelater luminosus TaxID=2038154 RepID=A0A8K0CDZ0_IGNLU|nr:hypothetical protein ILUMI_23392 [Ignelater luminosus]
MPMLMKKCHPIMIFMGICYNGPRTPLFVEPEAKINADYSINKYLKPLIKNMKEYFPNKSWKFHQDSAPAHTSRKTLQILDDKGIEFIQPDVWTPNSPTPLTLSYVIIVCGAI